MYVEKIHQALSSLRADLASQVSWCKVEATVSDPKDINPFPESDADAPKDVPPLTVMSLSARTIVNHQANNREIVCATTRIWSNSQYRSSRSDAWFELIRLFIVQIEDDVPPESLPCSVHTFVRPLDRFPPNFEVKAKANGKGLISPMGSERHLLNNLLGSHCFRLSAYCLYQLHTSYDAQG